MVRAVGRRTVRTAGLLTAPVRPLPDFLVLGTKRGGTTALFRWLVGHPQVLPLFPSSRRLPLRADLKGVHYFSTGFSAGTAWYRSHFPTIAARRVVEWRTGGPVVAGEASPYYLVHPRAPERARAVVPGARLVVLLRDPAERAWSHYKASRRRGVEPLASFAEALDAEPDRLAGEEERMARDPRYRSLAHEHLAYVLTGRYDEQLARWRACFPDEQLLVLASEQLFADPQGTFDQVTRFLGLAAVTVPDTRSPNPTAPDRLDGSLRRRLDEVLAPSTAALEASLGRRFGWGGVP